VLELPVAALDHDQRPSLGFEKSNDLANFHLTTLPHQGSRPTLPPIRNGLSRPGGLARQVGMSTIHTSTWRWLAVLVLAHLVVSILHGSAHTRADVPLSQAAMLFVFVVIVAGPVIGLALTWPAVRLGSWLVAVTMAASLVFGVVNHFMLASPDHVAHVNPQWRPLFATTAVLLALTEALGSGLALRMVRERKL